MNSLASLLSYYDQDYTLLDKSAKVEILSTTLLYVFRLCSSSELTEIVKSHLDWTGEKAIGFRKTLAGRGIIQKNLKFYIYDSVVGEHGRPNHKMYGLSDDDAKFVQNFIKYKHRNVLYLVQGLKRYERGGYPSRSLSEFEQGLVGVHELLRVTAAKYVNKTFRWLTQSGQMDKDGLEQDMLHFAIYAIYRAYPEIDNFLHMKNIGIRAIHNRGVNILKEQSTQSRQRVFKNADGTFRGDMLSFDHRGFSAVQTLDFTTGGAINVCNHMMVGIDGTSAAYERPQDVDRKRDLKLTIDQITDRIKEGSPKTFVMLLKGEYHKGFSEYLGRDNDEACDQMDRKVYAEKVRSYLKVSPEIAMKFVTQLRHYLADFRC